MKIYRLTRGEVAKMVSKQIEFIEDYISKQETSEYMRGSLTAYNAVLEWLYEKEGR